MFNTIVYYPDSHVDVLYLKFGNPILFFISAACISIALIFIFAKLNIRSRFLEYLGRNSLVIMAVHVLILIGIGAIETVVKVNLNCFIKIIVTIFTSIILVELINRKAGFIIHFPMQDK